VTPVVFTFETTHHALWAEEIALACGLGAQVIPAPSAAEAKCNLALEVLPEDLDALIAALDRAGVEYRLFDS
jgi:hypothetical protein